MYVPDVRRSEESDPTKGRIKKTPQVRVSEHLATVDRSKRRAPERLRPMLRALNDWLAPRALRGGVSVPLFPCASGASLRVLRIVADQREPASGKPRETLFGLWRGLSLGRIDSGSFLGTG